MRPGLPSASVLLFVGIVVAVALWIGSGVAGRDPPAPAEDEPRPPVVVAVERSEAQPVERLLTLYGDIEPNQLVRVRAETAGRVSSVESPRGSPVAAGDVLVQLDIGDRRARLRQAEARQEVAAQELERSRQLVAQNVAPEVRQETARADLEAAEAEVAAIRLDIENTTLRAPIDGVVSAVLAEVGDFVTVGGETTELVDNDPLVAVVQVPQHAVGRVSLGATARVTLIGWEPVEGEITFIAPVAEAATRTFRVQIEVDNPEGSLLAGVSAEVVIPTETVQAHAISPAIVTLNDRGEVGVFSVGDDGVVAFHAIEFVRAEVDSVWVTGPPPEARLITARPGFVSDGQVVEARELSDAAAADDDDDAED